MILCKANTTESQRELINTINLFGDASNLAFNESLLLCAQGDIDFAVFKSAASRLVQRHDSLRMTFSADGTSLAVHDDLPPLTEYIDISRAGDTKLELDNIRTQAVAQLFNIETGPLLKFVIVRVSASESYIIIVVHHLVCDGWSFAVLLEDLALLYSKLKSSDSVFLPRENYFIDYMHAMQSQEYQQKQTADLDYWSQLYKTLPEPLELPSDFPANTVRQLNAGYREYVLDAQFVQRLRATAKQHKCSLVVMLMTAFGGLLNRLSGNESVVVALPSAGQAMTGLDRVIGHCVNTLPILINIDGSKSLAELLTTFRDHFFEQSEHQHITQGGLLKRLPLQRDLNQAPLASVMFNLDQDMHSFQFADISIKVAANPRLYEYFDMFLNIADNTRELTLQCQFNKGRYHSQTIELWLQIYHHLLEQFCQDATRPFSTISLVSQDPQWIGDYLRQSQGAQLSVPDLLDHLQSALQLNSTKTAVLCGEQKFTYLQLDARASQYAHILIERGVKPDSLVGVCLDRTTDMLACLLGIWKAGAGYVPLDPAFPNERLHYMVDTAKPAVIVTLADYQHRFPAEKFLLVDQEYSLLEKTATTPCHVEVDAASVAYVLFTSGSTGKPKGVQVPRRAVANFLVAMSEQPGMTLDDKLLAVTTLSFDISVLELFLPLWNGATVVIATRDDSMDGERLKRLIEEHHINVMQATPSTWKLLLQSGWQGSKTFKLLCGGEAFPADLVGKLVPICYQVWNMYGPTETTVWSTCQLIPQAETSVTIGRPIANTQCYVTDDKLHLLPVGVPGELLIGGTGVANGYIGRADLTAERFIDNPFGAGKLYRTGDKVRWTHDGQLAYFGRMDSQIKLRGYRIELGEIEVILRTHNNVKDCALGIVNISADDQRLVAYVVPQGIAPDLASVKQHLSQFLPAYMLPNNLVVLDQLPQTLNGKLDRKALQQLSSQAPAISASIPATTQQPGAQTEDQLDDLQQKLLPVWQAVLQTASSNIDDNFFDLGGHSILIAQLIVRIEELCNVRLSYREIYSAPSLRQLSKVVAIKQSQNNQTGTHQAITPRAEGSAPILSFAQQRLWFMENLNGPTSAYNLPTAFRFNGKLNAAALQAAFTEFLNRQQVMRSSIVAQDHIHASPRFSDQNPLLPLLDWSKEDASRLEAKFVDYYSVRQKHIFSLQDFPLYVAELIKFSDDEYILFFMPHHAVFDGGSFDIFVHELTSLYCKHAGFTHEPLQPLPIQYADFAAWHLKYIESPQAQQKLNFWVDQLAGELPVLEMPTDFVRPELDQSAGDQVEFVFEPDTIRQLTAYCKRHDVSMFMVLLAAYGLMLHRYTGQDDLVVGAPVADRHKEVEDLIGLFVNPLPLRLQFSGNEPFSHYLSRVREVCLQALDNSDVPFEKLVEAINPPRDLSRAPIFQTSLTYKDVTHREQVMGDIKVQQINIPFRESALDFNMWLKRRGDFFEGGIIYTEALFQRDTMERMGEYYRGLLQHILADDNKRLSEYSGYNQVQLAALSQRLVGPSLDWQATPNLVALLNKPLTQNAAKTAVICGDDAVSYDALHKRSNQLAHYLIQQGVVPGERVGVSMDRSVDMLVVLLGVLKAGAAYIPLDPDFPAHRLTYMVEDSGMQTLIGNQTYLADYADVPKRIAVEQLSESLASVADTAPTVNIASDSPCYMIYTSGSTGLPKGVVVPHGGVVNFLVSMAQTPGMSEQDVMLAVTTLSFDIAVLELYLPLLAGAKVVIARKDQAADGNALMALLEQQGVTLLQATPTTWRLLLASGWQGNSSLKALCGGEALPKDLAQQLIPATAALWNMYGPTETTVWSTCYQVQDANNIYLGKPIANTQCYILDGYQHWVPESAAGELCIGGDGVTLGYHQRDELTRERFINNPFGKGKLYRTGDKVRCNSQGELEYYGRMDSQIKLRGYRIEIGEIEAQLLGYDDIKAGAVVLIDDGTSKQLVAFYTLTAGAKNSIMKIRKHMAQSLPKYMIPEQFVVLESLPVTPNGKIDRKKLALEKISRQNHEVGIKQRPTTESEIYYAELWCDILKVNAIGTNDNFFDVGGHSMLSLEVANRVKKEKNVIIPPRIFVMSTLGQMASAYPVTAEPDIEINDQPVIAAQHDISNSSGRKQPGKKSIVNRLFKKQEDS